MRCPYCACLDTAVKDSRPTEEHAAIRRRRICPDCGGRFTTFERIQLRELTVVKRSGRKVAFNRDKLLNSINVALRKRPIDQDRIERMVSGIVRQLENSGETEIPSMEVGELVMEALRGLDPVAYVRFASVYRNFREAADFEGVLGEIASDGAHEHDVSEGPKDPSLTSTDATKTRAGDKKRHQIEKIASASSSRKTH